MTTPNPIHSPFSGQPLSRSKPLEEWDWRHPIHVWYFNPWTGTKRHPSDVESDPQGRLIQTSDSLVPASSDEGITLDFKQATELLELFEGKPREIVLTVNDGHAGPGLYAFYKDQWLAAIFLGESNKEARPGPERPGGEVPARVQQPAIMPNGESAAAQLRAMATNYPTGHLWDKLDAKACIRGALEIEALRASHGQASAQPAPATVVGPSVQADAHLAALLRYTGGFYEKAIEHGMKRGETAHAVAHVESAARALHRLAASTTQPAQVERTGCELGCTTECKAKTHGCASECPALPWQPQPAPAAQDDAKDAARYRWLTDGHERPATRIVRNQLCERLPWMSYSAVSAAIDSALAADKKEPT